VKRSRERRSSSAEDAPHEYGDADLRSATVANSRARLAMVSVGFACACRAALVVGRELQLSALDDYALNLATGSAGDAYERVRSADSLVASINLLGIVAWLVAGVLFLMWIHAAHRSANVLASGMRGPEAGSAVWSYFIPFANLVRPYANMTALVRLTDPRDIELPPLVEENPGAGYRDVARKVIARPPWSPPPVVVGLWWAAYVVMSIGERIEIAIAGSPTTTPAAFTANTHALMALDGLYIGTGILCIAVVRAVALAMGERARRLAIVAAEGPA
jgi:hypothetical protein